MKSNTRWTLILLLGLALLVLPTATRLLRDRGAAPPAANDAARYTPPAIATPALAATPIPTATPMRSAAAKALPTAQLARGPVVIDLAHYSLIERARFQPLASALAEQGLDLRFWLPTVDTTDIQQITDFPDLSAELEKQLAGASALAVISPYFLYTPAEIAVVQRFVRDGGRLLLISDPDIESDSASDTNQLAAAFNVIFNQDYLYDTVANDANFTYFFQGEFTGEARPLAGSRIAFYGGRSIDGAVAPQVRSADTTLSSLRDGLTSFNTVVLGGADANGSTGRVLAMSDFDVLTDPYVARHDNRRMLAFVADFLAGGQRDDGMTDFPNFLGQQVALAIDNTQPVGALALGKAAELQRMLEANGRQLSLAPAGVQTAQGNVDLIYVAGYRALEDQPDLLAGLDLRLVEEVVTPDASAPAATPATTDASPTAAPVSPPEAPPLGAPLAPEATPAPIEPPVTPTAGAPITTTSEATGTATVTASLVITAQQPAPITSVEPTLTATPTPTPTPQVRLLLERSDGLRLLADETLLYIRRTSGEQPQQAGAPTGGQTLAVLGASEQAISAAMTRLINRDFAGCLVQSDLIICPYSAGAAAAASSAALTAPDAAATPAATATPGGAPSPSTPPAPPTPPGDSARVLVVDDNAGADPGEPSEAAIYLTALTTAGYTPDLWVLSEQGTPEGGDLAPYAWVIWSDASYTASGIDGENLRVIGEYINQGGRLTISSRMPFFGVGPKTPSAIRDIQVAGEVPELVKGLPTAPIALITETPLLSPLEENPDPEAGARSALVRGPVSADQGAPVLILMSDAGFDDPKGARLLLFGVSMGWLPPAISDQLIRNMADVMLAE